MNLCNTWAMLLYRVTKIIGSSIKPCGGEDVSFILDCSYFTVKQAFSNWTELHLHLTALNKPTSGDLNSWTVDMFGLADESRHENINVNSLGVMFWYHCRAPTRQLSTRGHQRTNERLKTFVINPKQDPQRDWKQKVSFSLSSTATCASWML